MMALRMFKEERNPPLFREPLEEGVIRLAVLDLIFTFRITRYIEALFHREGIVRQQFIENLDDRLLLEDLVIGCQRREEQPRTQRERVGERTPFARWPFHLGHQTGNFTGAGANTTGHAGTDAIQLDTDGPLAAL
ncbi:hypothetical protein D3C81_1202480 [compost metagenome]